MNRVRFGGGARGDEESPSAPSTHVVSAGARMEFRWDVDLHGRFCDSFECAERRVRSFRVSFRINCFIMNNPFGHNLLYKQ